MQVFDVITFDMIAMLRLPFVPSCAAFTFKVSLATLHNLPPPAVPPQLHLPPNNNPFSAFMLSNLAAFLLQSPQQDTASQAFFNPLFCPARCLGWLLIYAVSCFTPACLLQLMHMHIQRTWCDANLVCMNSLN